MNILMNIEEWFMLDEYIDEYGRMEGGMVYVRWIDRWIWKDGGKEGWFMFDKSIDEYGRMVYDNWIDRWIWKDGGEGRFMFNE